MFILITCRQNGVMVSIIILRRWPEFRNWFAAAFPSLLVTRTNICLKHIASRVLLFPWWGYGVLLCKYAITHIFSLYLHLSHLSSLFSLSFFYSVSIFFYFLSLYLFFFFFFFVLSLTSFSSLPPPRLPLFPLFPTSPMETFWQYMNMNCTKECAFCFPCRSSLSQTVPIFTVFCNGIHFAW